MTPTQREAALRLAEPVALLWQLRHALALASAICDAVPNRDPGHLGVLVNAQPDGTHGYRLIQDAEAALVEYLTTPTSAEPQGEPVAWHVCSVNSDGSLSLEFAAPWEELAHEHVNDAINEHDIDGAASWVVRPVYASPQPQQTEPSQNTHPPQQRKPLTDYEIDRFWMNRPNLHDGELLPQLRDFARAIERAHGIVEAPSPASPQQSREWKGIYKETS